MDVLMLSRLQLAAATMFHFLFVPLTLGLSVIVAVMETRYARTGDEAYLSMTKSWLILSGIVVVFLVATKFATPLFNNYFDNPFLFIIVLIAAAGLVGIRMLLTRRSYFKAWFSSALLIVSATFFGIGGLYPNMFPSSIDPQFSLTAHNAATSPLTLKIMLTVVIIFVPIVIAYQVWPIIFLEEKWWLRSWRSMKRTRRMKK